MKKYIVIQFFSDINKVDGKEVYYTNDISNFMDTIPIFKNCHKDVIIIDILKKRTIDNMNRTWEEIEDFD